MSRSTRRPSRCRAGADKHLRDARASFLSLVCSRYPSVLLPIIRLWVRHLLASILFSCTPLYRIFIALLCWPSFRCLRSVWINRCAWWRLSYFQGEVCFCGNNTPDQIFVHLEPSRLAVRAFNQLTSRANSVRCHLSRRLWFPWRQIARKGHLGLFDSLRLAWM